MTEQEAEIVSDVIEWSIHKVSTIEELKSWPKIPCNKNALEMLPEKNRQHLRDVWVQRRDELNSL